MNLWPEVVRPSKRQRLDNDLTSSHCLTTQRPARTQDFPSLACSYEPSSPDGEIQRHGDNSANDAIQADAGPIVEEQQAPECCFGMLCDIPAKLKYGMSSNTENIPVRFSPPNLLSSTSEASLTTFEIFCSVSLRMIEEVGSSKMLSTQMYCHSKLEYPARERVAQNGRRRGKPPRSWFLNIILFGQEDLEQKVGEYFSNHKRYLQDPIGCERRVPYRNPHMLPPETGETVMTDVFDVAIGNLEIEQLESGPDLLAQLMKDDIALPETEAPAIVKTTLFPYQKQALTFLLRREQGWALDDSPRDIWSRQKDCLGRYRYINNVSGESTSEAPPEFQGGLLADYMGLGKTLSMICLIAANQANQAFSHYQNLSGRLEYIPFALKTTLLIVPPALIQGWEKQLRVHLKAGKIKAYVFHGQNRKDTNFLTQFDIVITTYHTVSAIWRKNHEEPSKSNSIFSVIWHRVILDEAHIIQNPQSHLAQACCALRSKKRWAITGTPIQNKLSDFASIVRFLGVYPYSEPHIFEEEIFKPWQNRKGTDARGFLRLKTLVRAITISRTKAVVCLPDRVNQIHHLDFTPTEREKYKAAKARSRAIFEEALSSGSQSCKAFNALWLLNILRLICNHGLLNHSAFNEESPPASQKAGRICDSLETPGPLCTNGSGTVTCLNCGKNIFEEILEGQRMPGINAPSDGDTTEFCEQCSSQLTDVSTCPSPWSNADSSNNGGSSSSTAPEAEFYATSNLETMPTKIKALVADLSAHSITAKSVVFSCWTNTLDLVQLMLNNQKIPYTRIDGKMSLPKRNESLRAFHDVDSVRVILVSITSGGAGLDLTAASRVYLLEPHWNAMVEEQALCRVHRVGQKRNVTTIRYVMRDSVEEQIVEIQKKKKMMAQIAFAQGPLNEADINVGVLQYLKSALA